MHIVKPANITPAMVTTNAVDADPQWSSITTYNNGEKATRNQRVWLSLQAGNTNHEPGITASAEWWSDAGPSNSWAMFDGEVETVTKNPEDITVEISPVNAQFVAVLNVKGERVKVKSQSGGNTLYEEEIDLWDYTLITDWSEYFFGDHEFSKEAVFDNLPLYPNQTLTVEIDAPDAEAQCGMLVIGAAVDVGLEKVGLQRSGVDYSQVTFDPFGKVSITKRSYARKVSTQTLLENGALDRVIKRLDALASVPVLVLSGQPRFNSTVVYGLVSYSVDVQYYNHSFVSIDVKGLI